MTIKRHILPLVILVVLTASGCQHGRPCVQISPEQAREAGLRLSGGVAADRAGALYLTAPGALIRYEPGHARLENLLNDRRPDIEDIAVTPEGALLALISRSLCAYVPGYLVDLYPLPGEGIALSCHREYAYVLVGLDGGTILLRITLTGKAKGTSQVLLALEDRPRALCAVNGGCLVASGGNIIKVTDPVPSADGRDGEVTTVLLVAKKEPVTGLAADQDRRVLYFATENTTYAWIAGRIIPVFPAGSRLALAENTLTICLPDGLDSQLIQIPRIAQHTQRLLDDFGQNP